MSQSSNSNITASGVPIKNVIFCHDPRDNTYKGLQLGYFTSGTSYITGSSIIVTAVNKTGTFPLVSFPAKKLVFVNHRDPTYRIYKTNETGLDYLRYIPCASGGFQNSVEILGIQNANEISLQTDNVATTALSGVCIAYS